jgi:hypothetical protein
MVSPLDRSSRLLPHRRSAARSTTNCRRVNGGIHNSQAGPVRAALLSSPNGERAGALTPNAPRGDPLVRHPSCTALPNSSTNPSNEGGERRGGVRLNGRSLVYRMGPRTRLGPKAPRNSGKEAFPSLNSAETSRPPPNRPHCILPKTEKTLSVYSELRGRIGSSIQAIYLVFSLAISALGSLSCQTSHM